MPAAVRFKPVSVGPSRPTRVGTTTTPAVASSSSLSLSSSHADPATAAANAKTSSSGPEMEENDKDQEHKEKKEKRRRSDSWTPAEDAVLLAAMITLPNPNNAAAVVSASSSAAAAPSSSSSQTSTSMKPAGGGGKEEDQVAAKGSESGEKKKEEEDEELEVEIEIEIEEAATPLARAAAWPPTTTTSASSRDLLSQQSQIASQLTTTTTTTAATTTTSAGWIKVHEIAERTYRIIMDAGPAAAVQSGAPQGGATTSSRWWKRDVKELEDRWRTKWRVEGMTKNRELWPPIPPSASLSFLLRLGSCGAREGRHARFRPDGLFTILSRGGGGGETGPSRAIADFRSPKSSLRFRACRPSVRPPFADIFLCSLPLSPVLTPPKSQHQNYSSQLLGNNPTCSRGSRSRSSLNSAAAAAAADETKVPPPPPPLSIRRPVRVPRRWLRRRRLRFSGSKKNSRSLPLR